jgi:hypothetical protein
MPSRCIFAVLTATATKFWGIGAARLFDASAETALVIVLDH